MSNNMPAVRRDLWTYDRRRIGGAFKTEIVERNGRKWIRVVPGSGGAMCIEPYSPLRMFGQQGMHVWPCTET
jgi:hypothetical protein